jgi:uncharacterized repeat protein (TIGR01451 family)
VIPANAADPFVNTVNVHASFATGYSNTYDKSAEWSTNLFQPSVEMTKTAGPISKVGDTVTYHITIHNTSSSDAPALVYASFADSLVDAANITLPAELLNGLAYDETVSVDYTYVVLANDPDPLLNTATVHFHPDGFPNDISASARCSVDLVHPNTAVSITPDVFETLPGGNVILTITEKNTGDCDLENISVVLDPGSTVLDKDHYYTGGDTLNDGILSVGEVWTWQISTTISQDTDFIVNGFGKVVGLTNIISYENGYLTERAHVLVKVIGATRTQGFWSTHLDFTKYVFETYLGSHIDLGWKNITNINDLMGIFWANNAKDSNGKKRTALCQAKVTASNQALAAILNDAMPGGGDLLSATGYTVGDIATILGGNDLGAIKKLSSALDTYNNMGDNIALDPSLPSTGRANPTAAKAIANIPFANCP